MMTLSPHFLEAVNGVMLVIYVGILIVFMHYILAGLVQFGWYDGYHKRKAAIAVSVLFFGDLVIRSCIWALRHIENSHGAEASTANVTIATAGTTIGVLICIFGGICILRHFAPAKLGHWPSIITIGVALVFGIGMAM